MSESAGLEHTVLNYPTLPKIRDAVSELKNERILSKIMIFERNIEMLDDVICHIDNPITHLAMMTPAGMIHVQFYFQSNSPSIWVMIDLDAIMIHILPTEFHKMEFDSYHVSRFLHDWISRNKPSTFTLIKKIIKDFFITTK